MSYIVMLCTGVRITIPNVLRDYASHVRWKASKVISDRFGDNKSRAGVEVSDFGTVEDSLGETSEADAS